MDNQELEALLENFENEDIEFREDIRRKDDGEEKNRSAKTAVAFYNTRGGKIIFGVAENSKSRTVIGLDNPQLVENNFVSQTRGKCNLSEFPNFIFYKYKGKDILIVDCPKGSNPPYKFEDKVLIRRGSNNVDATEEEIAVMYRDRDVYGYDRSMVKGATLRDINLEDAESYLEGLKILADAKIDEEDLNLEEDHFKIFCNIGLIAECNNTYIPTVAGILLFGKNPQIFFPNAIIKADVRYDDEEWADIAELKGTVLGQIEAAEMFFAKHIEKKAKIVGFKRVEEFRIPLPVLREVIVNAVAHRDYAVNSASIHLQIRKDFIHIISPGGLMPPLTLDIVLNKTFLPITRNAIIAQEILRQGYMERRGNGLLLIRKLLKKNGLPDPIFQDQSSSFSVNIKLPTEENVDSLVMVPDDVWSGVKIDKDAEKILRVIELKTRASLKDFEKRLQKTRGAFMKKIDYLLDKEIIERFPSRPQRSPRAYYTIHHRFNTNEILIKDSNNSSKQQKMFG